MGRKAISYETDELRQDVILAIQQARESDPNIGAVLLECTTLPPYAADVFEETGLPVFDFVACVEWMHRALIPTRYSAL